MEFWIIWGIITAIAMPIAAFTVGINWGLGISAFSAIIMVLLWAYEYDCYNKWENQEYPGDHFYLEWMRCKKTWRTTINRYDAKTYCKISFDDFQKYFSVNPSRYKLLFSCVTLYTGNDTIWMVFPRKDLFKYFLFRREYLQSRKMVDVINIVQKDIDELRETAQEQLDKAKAMLSTDFKTG